MNYQRKNSIENKKKRVIYIGLGILTIMFLWVVLSNIYNNSIVIPKIKDVLRALLELFTQKRIYELLFTMLLRILLTVSISLGISLVLSLMSYKFKHFGNYLLPIISLLKTTPVIAIIILLILSVGMELTPYVATSFVIIPMIYEAILAGLESIDEAVTDDIKTVTNINFKVLFSFYIPLIISNIVTVLIQSFGLGLKVMLMAEYISPKNNTFGAEIRRYNENLEMEKVFAIILVVIVIVMIVDFILKVLKEKAESK